jgi:hypothetical protein
MNVMDPSGGLSLSFKRETPSHWRSRDCSTYIRGEYTDIGLGTYSQVHATAMLANSPLQVIHHGNMVIPWLFDKLLKPLHMYSSVDRLNLIIFSA